MASWRLSAPFDFENVIRHVSFAQREGVRWMVVALCLLVFAPGMAPAQDVFAGGNSPNNYSDSFSSSCIEAQPENVWKHAKVNPLTCHAGSGVQNAQGQCTLYGQGTTVVAHIGTTCYYCTPINPPAKIYIPLDQVSNASKQGYLCGESSIDPGCMAVCSAGSPATKQYVPPEELDGGPPTVSTAGYDPCHPPYNMSTAAGVAQAQANSAKDKAACDASRCQHNPTLDVCKQGTPQQQFAAQTACPVGVTPYFWPSGQTEMLQNAVSNAKAMLLKAKAHTDKATWDAGTQEIAKKYFGTASSAVQTTMRTRINGELGLIGQMTSVNQNFTPDTQNMWWAGAYVRPGQSVPFIYVGNVFFLQPPSGSSDSQAAIIVHELSHLSGGGATGDVVYGDKDCQLLVMWINATQALAQAGNAITNAGQAAQQVIASAVQTLTGINMTTQPAPPRPAPAQANNAAMNNADSFTQFVFEVSQQ